MSDSPFVDYYEVMQINPAAEPETIQRVYRMLAARFHPDNPETGENSRFVALNEAYGVLSSPVARAEYDRNYQASRVKPLDIFNLKEFAAGIDGEKHRRMGILCLLYNRRRSNDERAGISLLELETVMSFPREHLMFTVWYLQSKALIRRDEESSFAITADGVDYVEAHLPENTFMYPLLNAGADGARSATGDAANASAQGDSTTESGPAPAKLRLLQ